MAESSPPGTNPEEQAPGPSRRSALFWMAGGAGVIAAGAVAAPVVGFLAGVISKPPGTWLRLKPVSQFPINEIRLETFESPYALSWDGAAGRTGAYVRYLGADGAGEHQFQVFAMNCTHLGCAVTWFPQAGLFMCPCHGGVYYENGDRASGPPPRGLYKMPWRVNGDVLEVEAPHLPTLQNTLDKPSQLVQLGFIRRDGRC